MNDSYLHRKANFKPSHRHSSARRLLVLLSLSSSLFCCALQAQTVEKPKATTTPEPQIKTRVLEDAGSRIEELHLRGHTQRIVVTPKTGALNQPYEIITGDGSRDLSPGVNTSRGAAGQRVWRVLDF
jgi:hypothetical protein